MGILQSWKNQSESWKSPGNLFLKKGTNPVFYYTCTLFHAKYINLCEMQVGFICASKTTSRGFKTSRRPPEFRRLLDWMLPATLVRTVCS